MDFVTPRKRRAEGFAASMRKLQRRAMEQGLNKMTTEEIDAEIAAARRERHERHADRR